MLVVFGDSKDGNWSIVTGSPNLNKSTMVMIECIGVNVKVTVGSSVYTAIQPNRRFAGDLTVYAGDPWWPAANATICNVQYNILSN